MLGKVDCILYSSSFLSKCLTSSQHHAKRPSLGPGGMSAAYEIYLCLASLSGAPSRQCRQSMASLLNAIGNQIPRRLSTKACQFFSTVLCVQCDICNSFIEIWSVDWWGRGCNCDFYRRYRFVVPILIDSAHEPTLWQLSLGSSLACPHPNSDQQGLMPCITESELSSISKCCHLMIFPRVIPQAVSVRYGLSIGATCAPLVLGMMYLFGWSIMISPLISIS